MTESTYARKRRAYVRLDGHLFEACRTRSMSAFDLQANPTVSRAAIRAVRFKLWPGASTNLARIYANELIRRRLRLLVDRGALRTNGRGRNTSTRWSVAR